MAHRLSALLSHLRVADYTLVDCFEVADQLSTNGLNSSEQICQGL